MPSIYRTARGINLDIDSIRLQNETTVAVGNQRVNARGDQLDELGNIIATRSQAMNQHYNTGKAGAKSNVPRAGSPAKSSGEAKERATAEADAIDAAKLQETIAKLTAQLAEKNAVIAAAAPPVIDLVDEIDDIINATPIDNFNPPENTTPLRGGLANAIRKQKEAAEGKNKGI
jgi:hypothetical protein